MKEAKPHKRIYVGKNSVLTKEEIEKYIQKVEKNTGTSLHKTPIISNDTQIFRNLVRAYVPKTIKQIPSRAFNVLATAGSPIVPGAAAYVIHNILGHSLLGKGDFYSPVTGTVNVQSKQEDTLAHELGHWVDFETGKGPYKRNFLGMYKDKRFHVPTIQDELNASIFAGRALKKNSPQLNKALATYLYVHTPALRRRSFKEWWNNEDKFQADPKYKANLPKALAGDDFKVRRKALRESVNQILGERNIFKEPIPWTINKKNDIRPLAGAKHKKVFNNYTNLAKLMLTHEDKNLKNMDKIKEGFVKRAQEYGIATNQAEYLYKEEMSRGLEDIPSGGRGI